MAVIMLAHAKYRPAKIPINNQLPNIHTNTGIPCFTTAISFTQFRLGCLRLDKTPRSAKPTTATAPTIQTIIALMTDNFNAILEHMPTSNVKGNVIRICKLVFECKIFIGFIGRLFKIQNDFPSIEIEDALIVFIEPNINITARTSSEDNPSYSIDDREEIVCC